MREQADSPEDAGGPPSPYPPGTARRNLAAGIFHGAFFQMATAFADPYALLPVFLGGFVSTKAAVGFLVSLVQGVTVLPQLPVARLLARAPHLAKPLLLLGIWLRCAVWGVLGFLAVSGVTRGKFLLLAFVLLLSLYSLGGGVAVLPFKRVISDTIPENRRGSFFGWRLLLGSLLGMAAGGIVHLVLGSKSLEWPKNYGLLFLLSFASLALAYTGMSMLRFPRPQALPGGKPPPFAGEMRRVLKAYPPIRTLILIRILGGGLPLVMPFLTLYAVKDLGIPLSWLGIFVVVQQVGATASNLLWIPMGNRMGTRILMRLGLGGAAVGAGAAFFASGPLTFAAAFFFFGFSSSALRVAFGGYVLELGTGHARSLLIAMEGTFLFPIYFMPFLGGILADGAGYHVLFGLGALLLALAFLLTFRLCEPRLQGEECGGKEDVGD